MIRSILVVCTGNICRSPMGEGLLKELLPDLVVISAGLEPLDGYPADPHAVDVMSAHGIDISAHRARRMSSVLVSQSDLILVAELEQKRYIERVHVQTRGKVFRICEFDEEDVRDPYRSGRDKFIATYSKIARGMEAWQVRVKRIT